MSAGLTPADGMAGFHEPAIEHLGLNATVFCDQHIDATAHGCNRGQGRSVWVHRNAFPKSCSTQASNAARPVGVSL